jgi:hypothetical protein
MINKLNFKHLNYSLQILVVAMGLMRFVGDTFRIKILDQIGFASGFSPLPLVFSDREGVEDYAHNMKINYETISNIKKTTYFDQTMYGNISGPLHLVGTYSVAIAYSPRFPENFWKPVLTFGFCNHGSLSQALKEIELIKSIEIEITHLEKANLKWIQKIECKN